MSEVPVVDIYWESPFSSAKDVKNYVDKNAPTTENNKRGQRTDYFFYQIYGQHLNNDADTLLYIGMSDVDKQKNGGNGVVNRLENHQKNWTGGLRSEIKIYIGSYGRLVDWNHWNDPENNKYYTTPLDKDNFPTIAEIEALLIYAHKPSINCASIRNVNALERCNFYLFNTGKRRSLFPELSARYYINNEQEKGIIDASTGILDNN